MMILKLAVLAGYAYELRETRCAAQRQDVANVGYHSTLAICYLIVAFVS